VNYLGEPEISQQWVPTAVDNDVGLGKQLRQAQILKIKATYAFEVAVDDRGCHAMQDIHTLTNTFNLRQV